ncbi:MAG: type II toxin-antitoxin system VapC family toxin [Gammaproteobacteria bacterium]|nr:type II toxin-antitoxin system VapC family toxin [Gammaproteobacteria bacterium]
MILVDTSVWIDHLRTVDEHLSELLNTSQVLMHPFVLGELACANLQNRAALLRLLGGLPQATVASEPEVLYFIDQHRLMGRGIGYIDAHLLAATALGNTGSLWTRDRRLAVLAHEIKLGYNI